MEIWKNLDINDLNGEIWKFVKDFADYQVSSFGRIKSFKYDKINGKILKQYKNKMEYYYIVLCENKKLKYKHVHTLVYENFYNDKLKPDECVHHKDENKENNYYENLDKMSKYNHNIFHNKGKKHPLFGNRHSEKTKKKMSENHSDRNGENHPRHKLLNQDIFDIRKSLELKLYTPKQLSWMFDISISTICAIKTNKRWSHVK